MQNDGRFPRWALAVAPLTALPVAVLALAIAAEWVSPGSKRYLFVVALALLASMCVALAVSRMFTAALRKLEQAAQDGRLCDTCPHLQQAEELKNRLISTVSHELNTPLHAVIGFTDLLLDEGAEPLSERQRANLINIRRNARDLLELVSGMLELARIQAGRAEVKSSPVDLRAVVDDCLQVAGALLRGRDVELLAHVPDNLPLVHTDEARLKRILMNLVSNAVKFTQVGAIVVTARAEGEWLSLTVADTGEGVPQAELASIFDYFERGARARSARGTGLGLAISRELARLLGGSLSAESIPGVGSAFTLRIPLAVPPERELAARTVLVAEPNAQQAAIVCAWLERAGFQPRVVDTARDLLHRAAAELPGAIVLESSLPDRDGWTVLRRLKSQLQTRDVPVLVATTFRQSDLAYELGAAACLFKPLERDVLLWELRAVAAARRRSALVISRSSELRSRVGTTLRNLGLRALATDRPEITAGAADGLPLALVILDCQEHLPEKPLRGLAKLPSEAAFVLLTDSGEGPQKLFGIPVVATLERGALSPEALLGAAKEALLPAEGAAED